jgi:hypothetical protein
MSEVVDGLVTIVAGLELRERRSLVDRLITSGILCESAEDALVIASRRDEPTTSYRRFRRSHAARRRGAQGKGK